MSTAIYVPTRVGEGYFADWQAPAAGATDNGKVWVYNSSTGKYEPTTTLANYTLVTPTIASFANAGHTHTDAAGGGQLDHGAALTGLSDDDHTQYLLSTGARAGATSSLQAFTSGLVTGIVRPASDSTAAIRVQNAAGTADVLTANTTDGNLKVGNYTAGGGASAYALHTTGIICAASGFTLRPPTVGDSAFYGIKLVGGLVTVVSGNTNIISFSSVAGSSVGGSNLGLSQYHNSLAGSSGDVSNYSLNAIIQPQGSHTLTYAGFLSKHTTNLTIYTTGVIRGFYAQHVYGSGTVDYRGFETNTSVGYGIYQSGSSAKNWFAGYVDIGGASVAQASLRIRSGTAPTSPNDGDIWYNGTDVHIHIGGTTYTLDKTAV